jgi:GNAT superfamily N-acetyltransferase
MTAMLSDTMNLKIVTECADVDWQSIADSLKEVGMSYHEPEVHRRAFEASHTTVFIYGNSGLLGFGRAISDGEYQGAIYDMAVLPRAQGKGVGTIIMKIILEKLPNCNLILYATPGMEGFYKTLGFGSMKTGMALFTNPEAMARFTEP